MRTIGMLVMALAATLSSAAHAALLGTDELVRRAEMFVQRLVDQPAPDWEVISPPGNTDPKMAIVPPGGGALQIIPAPKRPGQQ